MYGACGSRLAVWFSDLLSEAEILEAVDLESVDDYLASQTDTCPSLLITAALVPVPCLFVSPKATVIGMVPVASLLGSLAVHYATMRRFVSLCRRLSLALSSALSSLKKRQIAAFGVGLSLTDAFPTTRKRLVEQLRLVAKAFSIESATLVMNRPSDAEHLYANFFTEETHILLESDCDSNPHLITPNSITTLWELCKLLRSEFARIAVLGIEHGSFTVFRALWRINSVLSRSASTIEEVFHKLHTVEKNIAKSETRQNVTGQQENTQRETLSNQLEAVLYGVRSQKMSDDEVVKSLRTIITGITGLQSANVASIVPKIQSTKDESERPHVETFPRKLEPVDQVFEAVAHLSEPSKSTIKFEDETVDKSTSLSVLGELRIAIKDRAREFEQREIRALAAFHGVSEDEIKRRIEEENEKEKAKKAVVIGECSKDEELRKRVEYGGSSGSESDEYNEGVGVSTSECHPSYHDYQKLAEKGEVNTFGATVHPVLADQLINALKIRQQVPETCFGESSSEDSD